MAYGERYKLEFSDVYSNTTANYVATVYKKDYIGALTDLNGSGQPLIIETQRDGDSSYNPIISSIATLNILIRDASGLDIVWEDENSVWNLYNAIWDNNGLDILDLLTAEIDDYYLELKRGDDIIWKGYYITTSDVSIKEIAPIQFNLVFSDVSLIKAENYFESEDVKEVEYFAKDIISIEELILDNLDSFGLFDDYMIEIPYEFYAPYGGINNSGTIVPTYLDFSEIYIQKNSLMDKLGNYMFNYDILNGICTQFGLMCYQKYGKLYISSYKNLVNNNTRTYRKYTKGVGFTGTEVVTDTPVILNSASFRNLGKSQVIRYSQPTKYLEISSNVAVTTNNTNAFLWGESIYYDPSDPTLTPIKQLSEYTLVGSFVQPVRGVYATSATSPYNFRFGLRLTVITSTFDNRFYMISNTPVSVNQADVVSVSSEFVYDARRDGLGDEVYVKTSLVFISKDIDDVPITYYYNDITGVFVTAETYLSSSNIKNIKIPAKGDLFMKIYSPYCANYSPSLAPYYSYGKYAIIQTYKNNNTDGVYLSQSSETYYSGVKLNKERQSFDTTAIIANEQSYLSIIPYDGSVFNNPQNIVSTISNSLITKDYDMVLDYDSLAIPGIQRNVGEEIQKNNGLSNLVIEGDYKSDLYWIGDKFTYDPIGLDDITFVLLDFKMDFKQRNQNSILYSSEFKDTTGYTLVNKIIAS
jgi:hypothetical protein